MALLLDQDVAFGAAQLLRDVGIEATHVSEIGYSRAEDRDILTLARARGDIIVTKDADFHAELAITGANGPSTIRIRIEGIDGRETATLIRTVLSKCSEELSAGAAVSVQPGRIRIRLLPINRD